MHRDPGAMTGATASRAVLFSGSILLIRLVILPSILSLLGQRSWYLPRWLDWLPHLQVESPEAPSSFEDPVTVARRL